MRGLQVAFRRTARRCRLRPRHRGGWRNCRPDRRQRTGKSTLGLALLGLTRPPGRILGGAVELEGIDVLGLDGAQRRRIRGAKIGLIVRTRAPRSVHCIRWGSKSPAPTMRDEAAGGLAPPHARSRCSRARVETPAASARLSSRNQRRHGAARADSHGASVGRACWWRMSRPAASM